MKDTIKEAIEKLAIDFLTGKEKLSDSEIKAIYDPNSRLGKMSPKEAKEALSGWFEKISNPTRKKILKKMD